MDFVTMGVYAVVAIVAIIVFFMIVSGINQVPQNHALIIERFGAFNRIKRKGLAWVWPFTETSFLISLKIQMLSEHYTDQLSLNTKTKDNVFADFDYDVQFKVDPTDEGIKLAHYELSEPTTQMDNFLNRILLNHLPDTTLDQAYSTLPVIAARATDELIADMTQYGYTVLKVIILEITPAEGVVKSMNRINEEERNYEANKAKGLAEKILVTTRAEAEKEVKRLNGEGIALEREAIATGWQESILKVREKTTLNDNEATMLLLFTNWTDMMAKVGSSSNTTMVFMPSGPEGLRNFQQTLTNALLGDKAAKQKV